MLVNQHTGALISVSYGARHLQMPHSRDKRAVKGNNALLGCLKSHYYWDKLSRNTPAKEQKISPTLIILSAKRALNRRDPCMFLRLIHIRAAAAAAVILLVSKLFYIKGP